MFYVKVLVKKLFPKKLLSIILWLYNINSSERKLKPSKLLKFEVHLADHCNLNCKYCDHFSPLADKKFLDTAVFEKDCKRISELTNGRIESLLLLGGEPLLHPDIGIIINTSRKYFKKCSIIIYTNGILLLKQNEMFWKSCHENRAVIAISGYPISLDNNAIKKKSTKYNVKIIFLTRVKTMYKMHLDIEGRQDIGNSFKKCKRSNRCIFLEDGKLYTCTLIPNIKYFNTHFSKNLEISESDYIDIYQAKNVREILEFLCKPVPFCRYCNTNKYENGLAWGISKKEISEWT